MGQEVVCYDSVSSTNEVAKELARQGALDGTLIIADEQTAGKGRQGRSWFAPRGTSLLMSLILHPSLTTSEIPRLTMASSLAVANAIEEVTGLPVQFKWPNDILLREKKTGGILTEVGLSGDVLDYAVIGIGVNVNLDVSLIPEIADVATSIAEELGRPASRLELLRILLRLMESEYDLLLRGESPHERWMTRLRLLGDKVQVTTPWGQESGRAETVDADGALVLRRPDGTIVRITVGDVE
jgi:BirA family biotin operon repressor/biotin-[acetyl-CoA-carboxylase] ligase